MPFTCRWGRGPAVYAVGSKPGLSKRSRLLSVSHPYFRFSAVLPYLLLYRFVSLFASLLLCLLLCFLRCSFLWRSGFSALQTLDFLNCALCITFAPPCTTFSANTLCKHPSANKVLFGFLTIEF